jgi:DNA repair exonuclease SbcCD ATPase subunit
MYLRNHFLNTTALLLAPPDDPAAARQAERDAINVESMKPEDTIGGEVEADAKKVDEEKDKGEEKEEDEEDEEKEPEADKEETAEEKEERILAAKEKRKEDRQQRRIDKAVSEAKQARDELAALRKQMNENPKEGLTEEEVERRAEAKAADKVAAKQKEAEVAELDKNIDKLATQGNKADKEFDKKIDDMAKEVAASPLPMIEALAELDNENGGEVLAYLANNVDEYEEFFDSSMKPISERKMVQKLVRISDKVKEAKKIPPKARTKVPPPIEDIGESSRPVIGTITGKEDQETFNRIRAKQVEERRKQQSGY